MIIRADGTSLQNEDDDHAYQILIGDAKRLRLDLTKNVEDITASLAELEAAIAAIPAGVTQSDVDASIAAHVALADPHTQYALESSLVSPGAFCASVTSVPAITGAQATIVFNSSVVSSADYSTVTGIFTAPATGTYSFSANINVASSSAAAGPGPVQANTTITATTSVSPFIYIFQASTSIYTTTTTGGQSVASLTNCIIPLIAGDTVLANIQRSSALTPASFTVSLGSFSGYRVS